MDEEKRARTGDTAGSPRKCRRLERPAGETEADSGGGGATLFALMKFSGDRRVRRCQHVSCGQDDIVLTTILIKTCDDTPKCSAPECDNTDRGGRKITVCLSCESRICDIHGKWHAQNNQHWIALVYERPNVAYCFACEECYFITDTFWEKMVSEDVVFSDIDEKGEKGMSRMTVDDEADSYAPMVTVAIVGDGTKVELDVRNPCKQASELVSDGSIQRCPHVLCDQDDIDVVITMIKYCDVAPICNDYMCGNIEKRNIMVCLGCEKLLCINHAYSHAWSKQNQHWVALVYDKPYALFCFACEEFYFISNEEFLRRIEDDKDDFIISTREKGEGMKVDNEVGGHASGSVIGHAYPIKGIPNLGNTCYLNALVQCLLVLGRLRARMLGPDAPLTGPGLVLRDLFEDTVSVNNAGDLLDPTKLLACVRMMNSGFVGTSMQDSHEALCHLRDGLDWDERIKKLSNVQDDAPSAVAPTVIDSIFGGQISVTRSCQRCSFRSVSCDVFHDLSVPLPLMKSPAKSVGLPLCTKGCRSQRKTHINLLPAIQKLKSDIEMARKIAERGDSQSPASELEDVVMVKASEPLKADSTKVEQISQSKDTAHGPLRTQKDKVQGRAVDVIPQKVLYDVKVGVMDATRADLRILEDIILPPSVSPLREEGAPVSSGDDEKSDSAQSVVSTEANMTTSLAKVTTEDKGKAESRDIIYDRAQDSNSLASMEEFLKLYFEAEMIEWACENCSKVAEKPGIIPSIKEDASVGDQSEESEKIESHGSDSQLQVILTMDSITKVTTPGTISGEQELASDNIRNKNSECHECVQEVVPNWAPSEKQSKLLSGHDQNAITRDEGRAEQVKLGHSACQVEENQNEQRDKNEGAIQTRLIRKLPPVLTIHLVRSLGPHKVIGHVSFKEILDVGLFMDPSSEDRDNSSYRLVGVVEHQGSGVDTGHFVAYVRPSHQQHSSGSSSWFCASDANIREISLEEVLKCEAYLLFYERMEG